MTFSKNVWMNSLAGGVVESGQGWPQRWQHIAFLRQQRLTVVWHQWWRRRQSWWWQSSTSLCQPWTLSPTSVWSTNCTEELMSANGMNIIVMNITSAVRTQWVTVTKRIKMSVVSQLTKIWLWRCWFHSCWTTFSAWQLSSGRRITINSHSSSPCSTSTHSLVWTKDLTYMYYKYWIS